MPLKKLVLIFIQGTYCILSVTCGRNFSTSELLNADVLSGDLTLKSLIAINPAKVRMEFSHPLFLASALDAENYRVTEKDTGFIHPLIGISQPDSDDSTTFDLILEPTAEGTEYNLLMRGLFSTTGRRTSTSGIQSTFIGPAPFGSSTELRMNVTGDLSDAELFIIEVSAVDRLTNDLVLDFNLPLTAQVTGTGTLTVVDTEDWNGGKTRLFARYDFMGSAAGGVKESIIIILSTEENNYSVTSDSLEFEKPVELASFTVETPAVIPVNELFTVTITARDNRGDVYSDLLPDSEVFITTTNNSGVLAASSPASGFVDGILSTQVSYNVGTVGMKLTVRYKDDPLNIYGESDSFQVQTAAQTSLANFQLQAVPVASGTIRITWPKIPETANVDINDTTSGDTDLAYLSGSLGYYHHTGLADNTAYSYNLKLLDSGGAVLFEDTVTATTGPASGCTNTLGTATISSLTTWSIAGSPWCITGTLTVDTGGRITIERGAVILLDPAASIVLTNSGELIVEDSGIGLVQITTSDTGSPPSPHGGITFDSTAGPTVFEAITNNYTSGSIIRHIAYDFGGPITSDVNLRIDDGLFRNNSSGVFILQNSTKNVVTGSTFQNNKRTGNGGAVFADSTVLFLSFSNFEYNESSDNGGAVYVAANGSEITDSLFLGNIAASTGGAIRIGENIPGIRTAAAARNSYIKNFAQGDGGAQYGGRVEYSYFYQNQSLADGGGFSGANWNVLNTVRHNYFEENVASGNGGAVKTNSYGGQTRTHNLLYNSFLNNSAGLTGAAMYLLSYEDGYSIAQNYIYQNDGDTQVYMSKDQTWGETVATAKNVFLKHPSALGAEANLTFTGNELGSIENSYFENGAADCTAAFADCTNTGETYKTDSPWPFCVDTQPGADTPPDCTGPAWSKPEL